MKDASFLNPPRDSNWLTVWCTYSLYDLFLEFFRLPPGDDALNAESMTAVGEDAEAAALSVPLLVHLVHTDATHHVFALLVGSGLLGPAGSGGCSAGMLCDV